MKGGKLNETKMTDKQEEIGGWDDYVGGNFLKADNIQNENDPVVVINVTSYIDDRGEVDQKKLRLEVERNDERWIFDLNKTNATKCKEFGIDNPKDMIGKKIFFRKVLVRNPQTNKEVDSLRIGKIE